MNMKAESTYFRRKQRCFYWSAKLAHWALRLSKWPNNLPIHLQRCLPEGRAILGREDTNRWTWCRLLGIFLCLYLDLWRPLLAGVAWHRPQVRARSICHIFSMETFVSCVYSCFFCVAWYLQKCAFFYLPYWLVTFPSSQSDISVLYSRRNYCWSSVQPRCRLVWAVIPPQLPPQARLSSVALQFHDWNFNFLQANILLSYIFDGERKITAAKPSFKHSDRHHFLASRLSQIHLRDPPEQHARPGHL